MKVSALTYECLGYYNAIEHLIIRLLKYLKIEIPSGPFSHRDTLKALLSITKEKDVDNDTIKVIENLMAFRHIATKIYGFLINWSKLKFIIRDIETSHNQIKRFFTNVLDAIQAGDK